MYSMCIHTGSAYVLYCFHYFSYVQFNCIFDTLALIIKKKTQKRKFKDNILKMTPPTFLWCIHLLSEKYSAVIKDTLVLMKC